MSPIGLREQTTSKKLSCKVREGEKTLMWNYFWNDTKIYQMIGCGFIGYWFAGFSIKHTTRWRPKYNLGGSHQFSLFVVMKNKVLVHFILSPLAPRTWKALLSLASHFLSLSLTQYLGFSPLCKATLWGPDATNRALVLDVLLKWLINKLFVYCFWPPLCKSCCTVH